MTDTDAANTRPPITDPLESLPLRSSRAGANRRTFLATSGLAALVPAAGSVPAFADDAGASPVPRQSPDAFAVITDLHQSVDVPERAEHLRLVLQDVERRDPAVVLNAGDMTDLGTDAEFDVYHATVPKSLKDRIKNVPGNHESQWVTDALEAYEQSIGPTHYSFDALGLHFVALDPMIQHEFDYWRYGDLLPWLRDDLEQVAEDRPIVLFQHFPTLPDRHFLTDIDEFLSLIGDFDVRAIFAGHIHKTTVAQFNGITEVTGKATKNEPSYFWVQRIKDSSGHRMEVTEVLVSADGGEPVEELLVTIPLDKQSSGGELSSLSASTDVNGTTLAVTASLDEQAEEVTTRLYPRGGKAADWTPLTADEKSWSGSLKLSGLPSGAHRLEVRASNADGGAYNTFTDFKLPTADCSVAWTDTLSGRIHAGLAARDGLVLVGTTSGLVQAYRPSSDAAHPQWQVELGPVYKTPRFTSDGTSVLVPSADHYLYALKPKDGSRSWRTDLGAPLSAEVVSVTVDDEQLACTVAGHDLVLIDLDGKIRWRTDIGGNHGGTVASDGDAIYVGSGDGNAYAVESSTGKIRWKVRIADHSDANYPRTAYSSWSAYIRLLPDDGVLFTTYEFAYRLDRANGDQVWATDTSQGQLLYTPPTVTEEGILLFNGSNGSAHLHDPASGKEIWDSTVLRTSFGAGPISTEQGSRLWMVTHQGSLVTIDLKAQKITELLQVSTAVTYSTAVMIDTDQGQQIVAGDQAGVVRGVVGMS